MEGHPLISYSQLVRATDGFSETNLLGSGSFGSVYRGELNVQEGVSTNLVAVKVLKLQTPKALKSFTAECEALRVLRHRNLVKIITICSSIDTSGNDFKAIVYDFMPNGSLEKWLHQDTNDQEQQRYLNLLERVAILLDVAYALDYLHCHGPEPVDVAGTDGGEVRHEAAGTDGGKVEQEVGRTGGGDRRGGAREVAGTGGGKVEHVVAGTVDAEWRSREGGGRDERRQAEPSMKSLTGELPGDMPSNVERSY
ncbi:hypothetical protein HU200_054122 [Digitaria exilis]|uniref:Protein kinase domain-containing protein n=1 Tax=Digitaria exilis TaxID=1010633 RepID=A0A835E790_9POAL|nr:hypothetical protein HU200_054122 [Digitaria exilis]